MQNDVQWFVAALISEELMTREACIAILERVGLEADLAVVAQEFLNAASAGADDDYATQLLNAFQQIIEYATAQAATGTLPPPESLPLNQAEPEPVAATVAETAPAEPAKPKIRIAGPPPVGIGESPMTGLDQTGTTIDLNPITAPGIKTAPEPETVEAKPAAKNMIIKTQANGIKKIDYGDVELLPSAKLAAKKNVGIDGETLAQIRMAIGINPNTNEQTRSMSGTNQWIDSATGEAEKTDEKPATFNLQTLTNTNIDVDDATSNSFQVVADSWDGIADFDHLEGMSIENARDFVLTLLRKVRGAGASDLHLSAKANPFVRRNSVIQPISNHILTPDEALFLNCAMLDGDKYKYFDENKDINYALQIDEHNRFRVCTIMHKDGAAGSYRLVPERLMSLEELGFIPENVKTIERFLDYHNGLVLVTGPIGSGKTTTLASMVNIVNEKRHDHIITVEDPIEIVQKSKGCNVTQREVRVHTNSYKSALKAALREDPDVIVIGELHDLETIEMAITASETGHLVIGTLHTCDSANTLNRMLDVFPPTQQPQIRAMTSGSLRGIVCQRLLPTVNGGMTVAAEILVNNMAVANIISDGRTHQLRAVLQTGSSAGMVTMDVSILNLYKRGLISRDTAKYNIRGRDVREEFQRFVAVEEAKKLAKK